MPPPHLTGELVTVKGCTRDSFFEKDKTGIIIAAKQAHSNPSFDSSKTACYPWVYYVLVSTGSIVGPLFSAEFNCVSKLSAR